MSLTEPVRRAVAGCNLLVCETNHDEDWVRTGPYPYYLKQRILGDYGHLSNETGAELAAFAVENGTRSVILAHLSQTNNTPLSVAPHDTLGSTWSPKEVSVC